MNDIRLDEKVLVDKLGRVGVVGVNSADLARGEKYVLRLFRGEEPAHRALVGEIELLMSSED